MFMSVSLLLLLLHQSKASTEDLLIYASEFTFNATSCEAFQSVSCKGQCERPKLCSCDAQHFNTSKKCFDSSNECSEPTMLTSNYEGTKMYTADQQENDNYRRYSCEEINGITYQYKSYCPKDWIDNSVRRLCEVKPGEEYRQQLVQHEGKIYLNQHCALCNGAQSENLVYWKQELRCGYTIRWDLNTSSSNPVTEHTCCRNTKVPNGVNGIRCLANVCSCDIGISCYNYTLPVINNISGIFYNNPHCYACSKGSVVRPTQEKIVFSCASGDLYRLLLLNSVFDFQVDHYEDSFPSKLLEGRLSQATRICEGDERLSSCPAWIVLEDNYQTETVHGEKWAKSNEYDFRGRVICEENWSGTAVVICLTSYKDEERAAKMGLFSMVFDYNRKEKGAIYYSTLVAMTFSVLGLSIAVVMYVFGRVPRTAPSKLLLMPISYQLITYCIMLIAPSDLFLVSQSACTAVSVLLHYLWLAVLVSTAICGLHSVWFFARAKRNPDRSHKVLIPLASTVPLLFIAIFLLYSALSVPRVDRTVLSVFRFYGDQDCFITSENYMVLYVFGIPLGLFLSISIGCYATTAVYVTKMSLQHARVLKIPANPKLLIYTSFKFSMFTGFAWIFAFIASYTETEAMWFLFILFTTLQGVCVAITFVVKFRTRRVHHTSAKRPEMRSDIENLNNVEEFPLSNMNSTGNDSNSKSASADSGFHNENAQ